jgi:hypothetical protein
MDKFPNAGKHEGIGHTPAELLDALQYAYRSGFDSVYIEQVKALTDERFHLTQYGQKVVEFQHWRATQPMGDWRVGPIDFVVKRFPDGYWGQAFSTFVPDHPYGSWTANSNRGLDAKWFQTLNSLSKGAIPVDADTWNAQLASSFKGRAYRAIAGLPPMIVVDSFSTFNQAPKAQLIDLSH